MFELVTIVFLGFLLDLLLGDPHWMPHPVRAIGWMIAVLERPARRMFPKTKRGELCAGAVVSVLTILTAFGAGLGILWLARHFGGRRLAFAFEVILCWQCIAARALQKESKRVFDRLAEGDLEAARRAVSMIVGRDTQQLSAEQVTRAAVETVAENTSDGVVAPLVFLMLGGAPLGLFYKAINTLDSMIGYQNDRYRYFGRFAAKLDDLVNWIPARLSALLMILAAYLLDWNGRGAFAVWRRDRRRHASPNSAQTESACAGALDIQLAGDAYYQGVLHRKPTIGDPVRGIEPADILRAGRLMYATALLGVLVCAIGKTAMIFIF